MPDNGTADRAVTEAQAAAEGVAITRRVEFKGRSFRLGPCTGIVPMLDFAKAASKGLDTDDPAGMAAMYDMLEGCFLITPSCGTCEICDKADRQVTISNEENSRIAQFTDCPSYDPGDFPRFWRLARATAAGGEELMEVVQTAVEQAMARPTPARSGSSSPARSPSANSKGTSSSPAMPAAFREAFEVGDTVSIADVLR